MMIMRLVIVARLFLFFQGFSKEFQGNFQSFIRMIAHSLLIFRDTIHYPLFPSGF